MKDISQLIDQYRQIVAKGRPISPERVVLEEEKKPSEEEKKQKSTQKQSSATG